MDSKATLALKFALNLRRDCFVIDLVKLILIFS
jgi:hypothetical protein